MNSAIQNEKYPSLAIGYPDHIVGYLSADILRPLDSYLSAKEKSDYYSNYIKENYFPGNDGSGKDSLYGVPFNKSTEILGYNKTFVDYCEFRQPGLKNLPKTWQEWQSKGPDYNTYFEEIINSSTHSLYGKKTAGVWDFKLTATAGYTKLIDCTEAVDQHYLMGYDATDNAFITFLKLWGAEYTVVPNDQKTALARNRTGHARFTTAANLNKAATMLEFFNGMHKANLFTHPGKLGANYCSKPFEKNQVMFMIASSGGLSHNEYKDTTEFGVATVPYYDDGVTVRKYVIAQGANIFITDKGDAKSAVKVLKALTTGEAQAEWCYQTGYFPGSASAANHKRYKELLNYSGDNKLKTVYKEAAILNRDHYNKSGEGWVNFVDPAFVGSAALRETLTSKLQEALNVDEATEEARIAKYKQLINNLKNHADLRDIDTLEFDS
jgi:multiple sugar transport system substrate-binding protein